MNGEKIEGTCCEQEKEKRNSQCEDPRTFDGSSQGGDLSTPKANSQGKGPKNLQRTSGKVASSEEAKGEEVKEKEKSEAQKKQFLEQGDRKDCMLFLRRC